MDTTTAHSKVQQVMMPVIKVARQASKAKTVDEFTDPS
jgi:hypothetical protein